MEENSRRSYGHLSGKVLNCVFAALMMAMFVGSLDQTITSTAMASIVRGLSDTLQQAVHLSYNEALTPMYLMLAPMLAICVVLMALCKSKPLSDTQD
ncbi:hypothetical protein ET524_02195 [Senegalimassilia faecalis]|uniref:MFS transporter n=1 Tax=Senegalimassilia faecalis TaxID=2509433 RepID=A0A4Q2JZM0_9ACTN|nr:hypothetical protein [Senegalimassilia faecalis]RXZ53430.1 hypothetical protein ET524_02195 [Senegalimassilia faecalis]